MGIGPETPLVLVPPSSRRVVLPAEGSVQVWCASRDVDERRQTELVALLDDAELARMRRFLRPQLGRRFAAGRGIVREILGATLGRDPRGIRFEVGPEGKPFLPGNEVQFNVSDSNALLALALTRSTPVGVDVEHIALPRDLDGLIERVFSPRERDWWLGREPASRLASFYRVWTRKEALLKATGEGIRRELAAISVVGRDASGSPRLEREPERDGDAWTLLDFDPAEGFAGALALRGPVRELTIGAWR